MKISLLVGVVAGVCGVRSPCKGRKVDPVQVGKVYLRGLGLWQDEAPKMA